MWHQSVNCNFMKPREYFLSKENKNNEFIPHFRLYCFSCGCAFTTVHDASAWWRTMRLRHVLSWTKMWNKFVIFVSLWKLFLWLHKITVDRLMSHGLLCRSSWYFSGPWSCKDPCCLWEGQRALRYHQKYLNLCSKDERRSNGFGTTSGWVINDRIFIFGWTNPIIQRVQRSKDRLGAEMISALQQTHRSWNALPDRNSVQC